MARAPNLPGPHQGKAMVHQIRTPRAPQPYRAPPAASAIDLIRTDHRRICGMFRQFARSHTEEGRAALAGKICQALVIHMMVEEEVFHPAFLEATSDRQLHCQAEVEHEAIKRLIAAVTGSPPAGELFTARMNVLAALVQHHVEEEERRDGMLAAAASAGIDGAGLAGRMRRYREHLKRRLPLLQRRLLAPQGDAQ
jgi:hypothetical protein